MLTQTDFDYRKLHGVVPQLDHTNNKDCLSLIPNTPVIHTRFATQGNILRHAKGGKIAGGFGNAMTGMLHMASGDLAYGLGKFAQGAVGVFSGAVDPTQTSIDNRITQMIQSEEIAAWPRYSFLTHFVPAQGSIGDVYFRDGSCDDFHCGNGYRIFDNGDYFEGLWNDGEISWGIYIWANGERYIGNFADAMKQGNGLTVFADGTYYCGMYEQGHMHGMGTRWYSDGVYVGDWELDSRHGEGACRFSDGNTFFGDWEFDEPVE